MNDRDEGLDLVSAAAKAIEQSRQQIDDLNVYPVPDGDTGTNVALTVRAVVAALEQSETAEPDALAREIARAALMGARGNSGVILSQIVRGAAEALALADGIDASAVADALRSASDAAYRGVRRPVEGTMLTVIRELAEEAERADPSTPVPDLLDGLVRHGDEAVERTPEVLAVLREAGVVDAGAAALVELLRGIAAAVAGRPLPEPVAHEELPLEAVHQALSRYRYCTSFVVEGTQLDREQLENELEPMGDSLLVVGDAGALKVHVHTDDPGAALASGTRAGVVEAVEIANMHRETLAREERLLYALPDAAGAVVAVVAGAGNRRLFESLGAAEVVDGARTMNPSTSELLDAIERAPADEVLLLPNNANVFMAAEQAAAAAAKPVRVLPSRSLQAGLAAMVAFDPGRSAEGNAAEIETAIARVAAGAVTTASRDVDGIAGAGDYLGLLDGEPVAGGTSFDEVARTVVEYLLAEPRDVLTLLTGEDEPPLEALLEEVARRHPELELDVQAGGQPNYPLLLAAE
ncbi:MAG: DAK2 domain-containing protein [Gaiellaceae bacterium]